MKSVERLLINIISLKFSESKLFYTSFFDFEVDFDSDWFIHLVSKDRSLELGLINPESDILPQGIGAIHNGFYLTVVIDDVDELYKNLQDEGIEILQTPHDTFYGQRRLLIREMNGVVIDVSSPIKQ